MASVPAIIEPANEPLRDLPWAGGLTDKEWAFVLHMARYRNATQAYTHAYDTNGTYNTRARGGREMMGKPRIAAAVKECQRAMVTEAGVSVGWLLERFLDIATADVRELIGLQIGCCRYCHGEGHGYQWREREYLEACTKAEREQQPLPDPAGGFDFNATRPPHEHCPQCHGEGVERFVPRDTDKLSDQALLLYGGVKVKSDGGYEIVIADRTRALELAGRIMGAFTDKVKISGAVANLHAVTDLKNVDPQAAAKAYREFIGRHLTG
jgi:phage terminase small subunit